MPAGKDAPKPSKKGLFVSVEMGRTGMVGVFVIVSILRAALNRNRPSVSIAVGIVFVGV